MKIEIGKNYKVIPTPAGRTSSGCPGTYPNDGEVTVKVISELDRPHIVDDSKMYVVEVLKGRLKGNGYSVYKYELKHTAVNIEILDEEIKESKEKIKELEEIIQDCEEKKKFLKEQKIEEFSDEEEFKAYQVLKVMGIDDMDKARQIIKILGR